MNGANTQGIPTHENLSPAFSSKFLLGKPIRIDIAQRKCCYLRCPHHFLYNGPWSLRRNSYFGRVDKTLSFWENLKIQKLTDIFKNVIEGDLRFDLS